jgi:hypothetical protein
MQQPVQDGGHDDRIGSVLEFADIFGDVLGDFPSVPVSILDVGTNSGPIAVGEAVSNVLSNWDRHTPRAGCIDWFDS